MHLIAATATARPDVFSSIAGGLGILFFVAFGAMFYFLPSIIGFVRKKSNAGAIFVLNLLLGWSLIGWVVSLVWAITQDAVAQQVIVQAPYIPAQSLEDNQAARHAP